MDHPVGAFIHNRGRGERARIHPDDYHSSCNRSLKSIKESLRKARLISEGKNASHIAKVDK